MQTPTSQWLSMKAVLLLFPLILAFTFSTAHHLAFTSKDSYSFSLERDTTEARQQILIAHTFMDSAKYDSAIVYFEKGAELYQPHLQNGETTNLWEEYLSCRNKLGHCYTQLDDYPNSAKILNGALLQAKENLGEEHKIVGDIFSNIGIHYWFMGDVSMAVVNYQKALEIRKSNLGDAHPTLAVSYSDLGLAYQVLGKYPESIDSYQKALEIRLKTYGKEDKKTSDSYNNLGNTYYRMGNFEAALNEYKSALSIQQQVLGEHHRYTANSYNNIGAVHINLGDYDNGLEYMQRALKIRTVIGENDKSRNLAINIANTHNNLGAIYLSLGNYNKALVLFNEALSRKSAVLSENHYNLTSVYTNLGELYQELGEYRRAAEYFQKSININVLAARPRHPYLIKGYNQLADSYRKAHNYEEALKCLEKALVIGLEKLGKDNDEVANTFFNRGLVYLDKGLDNQALENLQESLNIRLSLFGEVHPGVANAYSTLGLIYMRKGNPAAALKNYQNALSIRTKTFGEKHPDVSQTYNAIGAVYSEQNLYKKALANFQQALIANSKDFVEENYAVNPVVTDIFFSKLVFLKTLIDKANTLHRWYQSSSSDLERLQLSHQTYDLGLELVDQIRESYLRQEDKAELLENAFTVSEGFIQTAFFLHHQTRQDSFLHRAFRAFEKSRSRLLLEEMQATEARTFAGIPPEVLALEEDIAIRLNFYEKSLYEERLKGEAANDRKLTVWQEKIFQLRQTNDSITRVLENEYPEYYAFKYGFSVASLSLAQDMLPDEESALLEFFVGDSEVYVFAIRQKDYQLLRLQKDFPLEQLVAHLRESLFSYHLAASRSEDLYLRYADSIANIGHQLYQNILEPITHVFELPERLIISPDGMLSYLPFDLLLTELPVQNEAFREYSYLLKRHKISYTYSATLLQEMQKKHNKKATNNFVAFAPAFEEKAEQTSEVRLDIRANLGKLDYNIPEAENLSLLMGGKAFTGQTATKENFLQHASHYRILHMATHGKANDQIGEFAYLAFSSTPGTIESEKLYNRDLYNLRLNADMVVLSACETGIGELQRGEGIISLARGFSYAGTKSLITSLWSVDDSKTQGLMEGFYRHLKANLPKDEALRQAKLAYLQQNTDFEAHPFFWASFIAIGDMGPLELQRQFPWLWIVVVGILVLLGVYGIIKRIQKKSATRS